MDGVAFPTPLKDISRIETQNNISINVFGYDHEEKVYPLYLSKSVVEERHINLLLIRQGAKQHYCLIRNFSRLMSYRTKAKTMQHFCYSCLHGFIRRDLLESHKEYCYKQKAQTTKFPEKEEDKEVKFKAIKKQLPAPFMIYADFKVLRKKSTPATLIQGKAASQSTSSTHHPAFAIWWSAQHLNTQNSQLCIVDRT